MFKDSNFEVLLYDRSGFSRFRIRYIKNTEIVILHFFKFKQLIINVFFFFKYIYIYIYIYKMNVNLD